MEVWWVSNAPAVGYASQIQGRGVSLGRTPTAWGFVRLEARTDGLGGRRGPRGCSGVCGFRHLISLALASHVGRRACCDECSCSQLCLNQRLRPKLTSTNYHNCDVYALCWSRFYVNLYIENFTPWRLLKFPKISCHFSGSSAGKMSQQ